MGRSYAYFGRERIGDSFIGIVPSLNRLGGSSVTGLDREIAGVEYLNPNFEIGLVVLVGFHSPSYSQRTLHGTILDLQSDLMTHASTYGKGWLAWISDSDKSTTTSNSETAGSDVQIEVASISSLDLSTDDYVLIIPPVVLSPASEPAGEVCKVNAVGAGDFTVDTLVTSIDASSTVYKVWMAYPDCIFIGSDIGEPVEQAQDIVRFSTSWRFLCGGTPVKSTAV